MTGLDSEALGVDEVDALMAGLRIYRTLVLAVSGGSDSTALMHLVHAWNQRCREPGRRIVAVTVDHGLRPESAVEAAGVARQAAGLGIEHRTRQWVGPKPESGLQEAARDARYALLYGAVQQTGCGPGAIVTAHTADDQAETLLMRLARGSGVDGLAAIPGSGRLYRRLAGQDVALPLLRPLLTVPRSRLVATLAVAGIPYSDDPSNRDMRFERVRIREALAVLEGLGVTRSALARTAGRMQSARAALDHATDALWTRAVDQVFGLVYEVDRDLLTREPAEIGIRLLRQVLAAAGGDGGPADLSSVESAYHRIISTQPNRQALALGGCIVETFRREQRARVWVRVYREPDRAGGPASIHLAPGEDALWDGRVRVRVSDKCSGPVEFGPLGDDWPRLAARHPCLSAVPIPAAAARSLPTFRNAGEVVAAPFLVQYAWAREDEAAAAALTGPLDTSSGRQSCPLFQAWPDTPISRSDISDP